MLKFHKTSYMFRSLYDHPQGVGVCSLPLCLVLTVPDTTARDTHLQKTLAQPNTQCMLPHLLHGERVMVYSVTLARTDILPEDGHTVTETCRRFYEILTF